jgi:predicted nucleic acid binding AN1-type Zn finger protein
MTSSLSESPLSDSQEFMMQQAIRMVTIPEAVPTQARICVVAFWKLNSNRARKNMQTLNKLVIVTIWKRWNRDAMTHDHISRAYVKLNKTAKGSR